MSFPSNLLSRTIASPRATRFFFDRVVPLYRWLTNNPMWLGSLQEMSRHFPPSTSQLRLLDVGCGHGNSTRQFLELRSDVEAFGIDFSAGMLTTAKRMTEGSPQDRVHWLQGDITRLPMPDNSIDAITGHSVYYMLADQAGFLGECLRVLRPGGRLILLDPAQRNFPLDVLRTQHAIRVKLAVLSWHTVSLMHQRFTLEEMARRLEAAGFARVLSENAVEGYGVLSRGEKPYAEDQSTIERVQQIANTEATTSDLTSIPAINVPEITRGRNLFLLVKQTPNKPAWALKPDESIRWDAATMRSSSGVRCLLAFTSLPKAVEFMQSAVLANHLAGINKVAKFEKSVAPSWVIDMLLNPTLAALNAAGWQDQQEMFTVDPAAAVTGDE
ncbi:MAG: methyltransferase domain-containing protein [Anaerolineae bacterium]|nr:methyltransferase domain-containing protein [Anaerolineae bacterium]